MKLKTKLFMAGIAAAGMLIFAADNVSYAANGWQTSGNSWIYIDNDGSKHKGWIKTIWILHQAL